MPTVDKRYNVRMELEITDLDGGPFMATTVEWAEVPMLGVLEIEKGQLEFLTKLNELGYSLLPAQA